MVDCSSCQPRYDNLINQGSFGDIYHTEHDNMCVKLTMWDESSGECNRKIIRKLNHPNLMRIFGYNKNNGNLFSQILIENLKGMPTLKEYISKNRIEKLSNQVLFKIIIQIVDALVYLHQNDITHRDIKLENILIDGKTHHIKIIDFGLAYYGLPCKGIVGTSGYFAPEMIYSSENYDHSCDMWSLGCCIYHLCCGYFPLYFVNNKNYYIQQLMEQKDIVYKDCWNGYQVWKELCEHLLLYDYKKRFTAKEVFAYLKSHEKFL